MPETHYNKLVRDKIPEIINTDGRKAIIRRISSTKELKKLLAEKLVEESKEYLKSEKLEELADIIELIYSILKINGINFPELEKMRVAKKRERGGFDDRIFLISTID